MESSPQRRSFSWKFWRALLVTGAGLATLIALFYAEENWRGKHAWESYKREMESKGVIFDYTKYVPPQVPDNQNFAMTPFFAPFFDFIPGTQKPRDTNVWQRSQELDLPRGVIDTMEKEGWRKGKPLDLVDLANELASTNRSAPNRFEPDQTQEAARAILEYSATIDPVLNELRDASHRPYSRFNLDYDWKSKFEILLPHLGPLGQICARCELLATAHLALDQTDKAFDDVSLMFHMLGSIRNEPFLIEQVMRASRLARLIQPIWEGLGRHQWSDAQLTEFGKELGGLNYLDDATRSLRAEESFDDCFFSELRSNPSMIGDLGSLGPPRHDNTIREDMGVSFWAVVPRGWIYFEQLNYHRLYADEVNEVIGLKGIDPAVVDKEYKFASDFSRWLFRDHIALSRLLLPAVGNFEYKMVRAQTYANLAQIACALERYRTAHGQFPETLDALVPQFLAAIPRDVIMDQPLKYRRADNGNFILYSVGWNKKDDGGVPAKESDERTKGDWVWKYQTASSTE